MGLILRYLRAYRRSFLLGLVCLVATNALTLLIPWLLKEAVDSIEAHGVLAAGRVARYAGLVVVVGLALAVVRTWSRLHILGASRRVVADVRERLFAHLQTLPASFYARHRTGDLMSRAVNDLLLLRSLFGPGVLYVVNVALLYTAGLGMMLALDPSLTLAAVLPCPILLLAVWRLSHTIHRRSNAAQEQLAEISNKAQENLTGINQVKAYVRERAEIESFGLLSAEYRRRNLSLARARGLIVTLMGGLAGLSTIIVLFLGGWHVVEHRLTRGGLLAFMSYLAIFTSPTIMMGWVLGVLQRGLGAIRRVEEILGESSDLPGDRVGGPDPGLQGAVRFRGLTFAFPGGPPVLRDIDLDVPKGSMIGVVGRVGSGKSALLQLLGAVHCAPPGTLLLDGRDINSLPTSGVRAQVAMVPQETFLFSRSIADNIALGRPGASRERIEEVARTAQLTRDLDQFPEGLDTRVGERGITLSGGQRQRVALARALLMDPKILVLDDALSSVDADTEEAILGALRSYFQDRTTFVVSHRVSTVLSADRVVVLEAGRMAEAGTVQELLARDGLFARMHQQQQIERELEAL